MSDEDNEDLDLWSHVTKGVKPLKGREKVNLDFKQDSKAKKPAGRAERDAPIFAEERDMSRPMPQEPARDLDRRTEEKLRRGQMKIEASLDLHGKNRLQAHEALENFILRCHARGMRSVLVITGKGMENKGILRQEVPRWLYEGAIAPLVLQHYFSKGKHGGDGALYVLLRRQR